MYLLVLVSLKHPLSGVKKIYIYIEKGTKDSFPIPTSMSKFYWLLHKPVGTGVMEGKHGGTGKPPQR